MQFLRAVTRVSTRPIQSRIQPVSQVVFRGYASGGSPSTTPQSDSPDEQRIKQKTGDSDPKATELGGSTAKPVTGKGDVSGQSEEGGDPQKGGVGKDAKPLDAADK